MQHHAARLTTGNYYSKSHGCVTNMVTKLGWDLLEHRRANYMITMHNKIINNLANIPVRHQLQIHDSSTRSSASHKFTQLNIKLNCYNYSFLPVTIALWNTLPLEVSQLPSLEQVQHSLFQISASTHLDR